MVAIGLVIISLGSVAYLIKANINKEWPFSKSSNDPVIDQS